MQNFRDNARRMHNSDFCHKFANPTSLIYPCIIKMVKKIAINLFEIFQIREIERLYGLKGPWKIALSA